VPVVYAVLCHQSPRHVADLARALHHRDHAILLHADAKAPPELHAALRTLSALLPNVHVVDSVLCSWGGWSLVEATLRAIGQSLALPTAWRHFCLLSERHFPLQSPEMIAKLLPDGASFSDAVSLTAMDRNHRADLAHRFVRQWRELPGVGMFSTGARTISAARMERYRLGSQWIVLARAACERLWATRDDDTLWADFRTSLVPDETALMSVLLGTDRGSGLDFRKRGQTFVAWPHLGGSDDSGFDDDHVRAARARGHLFIRKRPAQLPPFAARLLASFPDLPKLPPMPEPAPVAEESGARALAESLTAMLRARFPGVGIGAAPPGIGPACCLDIRVPEQSPALSLHLVSHEFSAFKLLLAWRRPFDGPLSPIWLGGYETTIIGARLPGLTLAREVYLPEVPDNGFVNADNLAESISIALAAARRLSELVPAQAA